MSVLKKYDHVQILNHEHEKEGIISGSYSDLYGCNEERSKHQYSLTAKGGGKCAWYDEKDLVLIAHDQKELLDQWESEREEKRSLESDKDWIFANGPKIVEERLNNPIAALAADLGITNLWGRNGEGITYYTNMMGTLALA